MASYYQVINYRPEHQSISQGILVSEMVDEYQNEDIKNALSAITCKYFRYRKIRGDGNCFVRAVAFNYLYRNKLTVFEEAFKGIETLNLRLIKQIPQTSYHQEIKQIKYGLQRKSYYRGKYNGLFQSYGKYIEYFKRLWNQRFIAEVNRNKELYEDILARMMNEHQFFDIVIILYFRALCISNFEKNKESYRVFYEDPKEFREIQKNLRTYGQESQGLMIKCMADALNCKLVISQIDKKNMYNTYTVDPDTQSNQLMDVHLFYRPGHYDILLEPVKEEEQNNIDKLLRNSEKIKIRIQKQQQPLATCSSENKEELDNSSNHSYLQPKIKQQEPLLIHQPQEIKEEQIRLVYKKPSKEPLLIEIEIESSQPVKVSIKSMHNPQSNKNSEKVMENQDVKLLIVKRVKEQSDHLCSKCSSKLGKSGCS